MELSDHILIPNLDGVIMRSPNHEPVDGTLCISAHYLLLSSRKEGVEELWLLHNNIDAVERKLNGLQGGNLILKCKDFRIIQLEIESTDDLNKVAASIEHLYSIGLEKPTCLYPFYYRSGFTVIEDGWTAFRPESEFSKLIASQSEDWRISIVNKNFEVCPTYPSSVVVPKCIDDETIIAAANFREMGRFPVLSYRHEQGNVLMRSSQPLTGPNSKRCKEDERLINSVLGPGKRGYIIDTRTQTLAQAAKSRGGGFELEIHYPQWRRVYKPIDRHQVLLECLTKLMDSCNDTSISVDRWLSRLESSNWMSHIRDTLNCACLVAQCLDQEGASVLVHGSEGLDATLLVTSLTQIILNPDCRTVRGFEALVEREWLQAGYPFPIRHHKSCYSTASNGRTKNQAPTFLLFLDCVQQIHQQFPCSFEFSTEFLILLFEHSYASEYGTFLGTCEADRIKLNLATKTVSLWSNINRPDVLQSYINPMYDPNNRVIWPSVAPMSLCLWSELYLRWVINQASQKQAWQEISALSEKDKFLRLKATRLRRQLLDLQREANELKILTSPSESISIEP